MKVISLFNNKGGVGKTTLAFHLSHALAEMGKKVLVMDLDPQCNITICSLEQEKIESIWKEEDAFIDDYGSAYSSLSKQKMQAFNKKNHSIHYLLKPTEDGLSEIPDDQLAEPIHLSNNLDLIPGRLTVYQYESFISERFSQAYQGNPLAIRTITRIRKLAEIYGELYGYDFVIMDTSPSLGALNKIIISTVDGFIIPCLPDMFSLYGIRNIGNSLKQWVKDFRTIYSLISNEKRAMFPPNFVHFLGYTIYNAKKYTGKTSPWNLSLAHYNYAKQIPLVINDFIVSDVRLGLSKKQISDPIGGVAVMHSHNTLPNMAQKYHLPIWKVPDCTNLDSADSATIVPNSEKYYRPTLDGYKSFAKDFLERVSVLDK